MEVDIKGNCQHIPFLHANEVTTSQNRNENIDDFHVLFRPLFLDWPSKLCMQTYLMHLVFV